MRRRPAPLSDLRALVSLTALILRVKPDIVVFGTPKASLLGLLSARISRVPERIYVLHGLRLEGATGVSRRLLWLMEYITIRCSSRTLAVSKSLQQLAAQLNLAAEKKIEAPGPGTVGGVDSRRFRPLDEVAKGAIKESYGIPKSASVLGFVGRISQDKGLDEMTAIWRSLNRDHPNLWFFVVGPDEATTLAGGASMAELDSLPRVVRPGPVPNPEDILGAIDVLVMFTRREGFGMVVLEAASCGVPAVATRVTGITDAVRENETGILVDWGDVDAAIEGLKTYFDDSDLREKHGEAARSRASALFDYTAINQLWVDEILREE